MRIMVVLAVIALMVAWAVRASGDDAAAPPSLAVPEPITGPTGVMPTPGDESPPRDHFTPYETGGPENEVPYEALSPAKRAVVDSGRDTAAWNGVHTGYHQAALERAAEARAEAAAHSLGLEGLATTGVAP